MIADGLRLTVPQGAPWRAQGKASLCFAGLATFIGEVSTETSGTHFKVERMLPDLPLVLDPREIWPPSEQIRTRYSPVWNKSSHAAACHCP